MSSIFCLLDAIWNIIDANIIGEIYTNILGNQTEVNESNSIADHNVEMSLATSNQQQNERIPEHWNSRSRTNLY